MPKGPKLHTPAPEFELPDGDNRPVRLSHYRGKNVVLVFYPADWSPTCTSELALIQETLEDILGYNAEVLGISCDGRYTHKAWGEHQHLKFPLLSDFWPHGAVSKQYNLFRENDGRSERALVFVDPTGMIADTWVTEDTKISPGMNVIFNALEKMQAEAKKETHRG